MVEFGSHLFQSKQNAVSSVKVPSSLIKFGPHQLERRTGEEQGGVSSPVTFLEFGLGHFPLVEILNPAHLQMLSTEIGISFSVISLYFLLFQKFLF